MERTTFRPIRSLLLLLLALTALTVSALADNAPKPQLTVLVENPPQETYYLDLVAEGPAGEEGDALSWTYSDQEIADLDPALLSALTAAVPEGYHACTVQGGSGAPLYGDLLGRELRPGVRSHTFFYTGVPTDYQILVVTESGETWLSPPCARRALQSSVTVDWETRTVTVPSVARSYLLQFLCTLLPTLLLEGAVLLFFGYRQRRSFLTFLWPCPCTSPSGSPPGASPAGSSSPTSPWSWRSSWRSCCSTAASCRSKARRRPPSTPSAPTWSPPSWAGPSWTPSGTGSSP